MSQARAKPAVLAGCYGTPRGREWVERAKEELSWQSSRGPAWERMAEGGESQGSGRIFSFHSGFLEVRLPPLSFLFLLYFTHQLSVPIGQALKHPYEGGYS